MSDREDSPVWRLLQQRQQAVAESVQRKMTQLVRDAEVAFLESMWNQPERP